MFYSVTLEMSLKPFKRTDDAHIQEVCETIFEQWRPLIKNRKVISVMLWTADGSEMLDYTGDLEKPFEWCYFLGGANLPLVGDLPKETSLHERKQLYMENPPVMTYGILKKIVSALKEEGKKRFPEAEIRVGETFDIGPEFAISDFKYNRHKECVKGSGCDAFGFVDATALLEADDYPYAAYPHGMPDQTPMGIFMGKQASIFLKDMGFDYLWLSNGMGYSFEPWREYGKIYDGTKFDSEKLEETKNNIFLFWKYLRKECPDIPFETRGTNYSVGMDYASDGVPLYDIYKADLNIVPPPNSPWAALNDDMGIEVLGQLTRNCDLPGEDYRFRYYVHDIWWVNSPWYDRYEGNPYDIYIPLSLSRLDEAGKIHTPSLLNVMSVDNSYGDLPDSCANEVLPHLLKAEKDMPDEPGPLVLLYPVREYTTTNVAEQLPEMYFGDRFLRTAINRGFPLATVVSTDHFVKHNLDIYRSTILVVPAAFDNDEVKRKLEAYTEAGGRVIVYGSKEALSHVTYPCVKVDIADSPDELLKGFGTFEYDIQFEKKLETSPLPTMTLHHSDNAWMFNVYNRDTTVSTRLKFPLGAPIINGYNAYIEDGHAVYQFPRSVHGECRVFVQQENGVVRAREMAPVNAKYRRKIQVSGLNHAKVCLFAESHCVDSSIVAVMAGNDNTPVAETGWRVVRDPACGTYLCGEDISGTFWFCMT